MLVNVTGSPNVSLKTSKVSDKENRSGFKFVPISPIDNGKSPFNQSGIAV